jgi:hypothetical protein
MKFAAPCNMLIMVCVIYAGTLSYLVTLRLHTDVELCCTAKTLNNRKCVLIQWISQNLMVSASVQQMILNYTRKNAQVVTNLQQTCSNVVPITCQQDVLALLVPNLLTTCYKDVELNRLVTSCSINLLSLCNSTICQQVVSDNLVAT